ncbi:MAG: arylsulfatase [Planctomycetaceae bacterium]|nr:arylsulfatase [Planctomycetaceae bacterium]
MFRHQLFLFAILLCSTVSADQRPNIVVIMVDDMGWSDLGCYGGEIKTPYIDSLAKDGLRFTQFYNNSVCGATRASLLTGLYCQQAGHPGDRWNEPKDFRKCVLIPELLQAHGYHTAMVGKWQGRDLAVRRGFDRFFGPNCQGKISYWNAVKANDFYLDDQPWPFPERDFFMTDAFSDHAVDFLTTAAKGPKPFFLYVAYIAPHWPLHAREKDIAIYREQYRTQGWDEWRQSRIARQRECGLLQPGNKPAPQSDSIHRWIDDPDKEWQAERMATYAAQISNVDRGVGRMLEVLRNSDAERNTLVLFLSDNGAAPDGGLRPTDSGFGFSPQSNNSDWRTDGVAIKPGSGPELLPGPHDTFAAYGLAWATTSNTPLRDTKQSAYEGGIRTPLIARWPAVIKTGGDLTRQPGHVIDIMATSLDVAGIDYPSEFQGRRPIPMEGMSLAPIFRGQERHGHEILAWHCSRGRAIRSGPWKLVRPVDDRDWELYNLNDDPGETNNLTEEFPDRVSMMTKEYEAWRLRVGAE